MSYRTPTTDLTFFFRLGLLSHRYRWLIIVLWLALVPAGLFFAPRVRDHLQPGGFTNPRSEGSRAVHLLHQELGASLSNLTIAFGSPSLPVRDPAHIREMDRILAPLSGHPAVQRVHTWRTTGNERLISPDGLATYVLVGLDMDTAQAQRLLPELKALLPASDLLQYWVTGGPAAYADIELVSHRDLERAEAISLPLAAAALVLVFGGLVAAGIPVLAGGVSVLLTLALLYFIAQATEVSIFAQNIVTMLGLGISIDYALFIVSRFREEMRYEERGTRHEGQGGDSYLIPHTSYLVLGRTMSTAGRAVFFSGLTVLLGLLGLMTFDYMMLRSIGLAGAIVVGLSVAASLTLLPALLAVVGHHINALRISPLLSWGRPPSSPLPSWGRAREGAAPAPPPAAPSPSTPMQTRQSPPPLRGRVPLSPLPSWGRAREGAVPRRGFWSTLAAGVARRPLPVFLLVLLLLLFLGHPFLRVRLGAPDVTVLPNDVQSRQGFDVLRDKFGAGEIAPMFIVVEAEGPVLTRDRIGALYDYTRAIETLPGVVRIDSIVNVDPSMGRGQYQLLYSDPSRITDPGARQAMSLLAGGRVALVSVATEHPPVAREAHDLVRQVRALTPGAGMKSYVGGAAAELMDVVGDLYSQFPRALLFVVATTYFALAVQFRSLVLPAKAVLMDTLSILASYGALVLIFQDGNLSTLLRFTPEGVVDATVPIVMFCVLFGLSMDYEVFMLSRIKEVYDRTGDNAEAVASGLEQTGGIITSAALIIVAVSGSFALADIIVIKALGIGMAIAVALDATVVRALLVPATMHLLGRWNWWPQKPSPPIPSPFMGEGQGEGRAPRS